MSVLTLPARPGQEAGPSLPPVPWRRMLWVTWRQHRGMLVSVTAVLAAVALFLLIAGLKVHHDYTALVNCHPANSDACGTLHNSFNNTDWTMGNTILILMDLAPALLGMLVRRIIPAMAATLGAYLGLNLLAWLVLREDYPVAIDTANASLFSGPNTPNSGWILKTWTVGDTPWWRYIPASRFWPMQFIEAGWLLALSALLIAGTVRLVRRHAT
jgi:hypothetical protein